MAGEKEQEKIVDFKGGSLPKDKHRVNMDMPANTLWYHTLAPKIFCYFYSFKKHIYFIAIEVFFKKVKKKRTYLRRPGHTIQEVSFMYMW